MTNNKTMWWVRFLENYSSDMGTYDEIYEFCSEVHIPGGLNYGNGVILCGWLIWDSAIKWLYTYLLRIKFPNQSSKYSDHKEYISKCTTNGYYFQWGIAAELLALFSFHFRARFFLISYTRWELTDLSLPCRQNYNFSYTHCPTTHHPYMLSQGIGLRDWSSAATFLDTIKLLPYNKHQIIANSLWWYSKSVREIGANEEMFFINMVSCVEAISGKEKHNDELSKKLEAFLEEEFLDEEEKKEIKSFIQNRKVQQKFIKFILENSPLFFETRKLPNSHIGHILKNKPEWAKEWTAQQLGAEEVLKTIYNARSNYLHQGIPMYLSHYMWTPDWDMDISHWWFIDYRKYTRSDLLPYPRWFEEIVHHAISAYILKIKWH